MPTNHKQFHRHSIRLKGYDYSLAGVYFVTIVTSQRECIFGEIIDSKMQLNPYGHLIETVWYSLPGHFPVELGSAMVMPNHFHGVVSILDTRTYCRGEAFGDLPNASPQRAIGTVPGSLGAIIQNCKSITTRKLNQLRHTPGAVVWQRNYYDHIIRNERELDRITAYILTNPQNWETDDENPSHLS
jgi:putative transposase